MIRLPALIVFLAAICLLAPAPLRADTAPPAAALTLKDGRVLHNVRVMSDEGASEILRSDEGLTKVAKSILPPEFAVAPAVPASASTGSPELVMRGFDPNQAPEAPPPEPGGAKPKPAAKPSAPGAKPVSSTTFMGCSIISFQIKAFQNVQGCAEIVIRNDSDQQVMIRPGEVSCTTADGAKHVARNIITDSFPPAIKRREFVPPRSQIDDIFAFANQPLDISSVQWSR
jgi:hypothetical protein